MNNQKIVTIEMMVDGMKKVYNDIEIVQKKLIANELMSRVRVTLIADGKMMTISDTNDSTVWCLKIVNSDKLHDFTEIIKKERNSQDVLVAICDFSQSQKFLDSEA